MDAGIPRSLVLTGPKKAEVQAQPPETLTCGPGEVLVKIYAVGVCATDTELYDGSMGHLQSGLAAYPLVPGHEWSGEIVQMGSKCPSHLKVGLHVVGEHATGCEDLKKVKALASELGLANDSPNSDVPPVPAVPPPPPMAPAGGAKRMPKFLTAAWGGGCLFCAKPGGFIRCMERAETGFFKRPGAFSQRLRFPADQVHVVPDSVPWATAALAEPMATVIKAIRYAELPVATAPPGGKPPRVVLVGEGTLGLLGVQFLRWRGYRVGVIGASASRLARAKELGAEVVWNVAADGTEGLCAAMADDGQPPEYVVEFAGKPSAVAAAIQVVSPGGTVVLTGLSGNQVSSVVWDDIVLRQIVVKGSLASEKEDYIVAVELMSSGNFQSLVTHTLRGLESYVEAIGMVLKPPPDMVKVALLVQEEHGPPPNDSEGSKRRRVE